MSRMKNFQTCFDYEEVCQIAAKAVAYFWKSINAPYSKWDLDEIVDDTACNVAKRNSTYNPSKSNYRTWVSSIAVNAAISHWKKYHKRECKTTSLTQIDHEGKEFEFTPCSGYRYGENADEETISQESIDSIYDAIDSLDTNGMILLMSMDGQKNSEIAEAYDITPNSVGVKLYRAKLKLAENPAIRSMMDEYGMCA